MKIVDNYCFATVRQRSEDVADRDKKIKDKNIRVRYVIKIKCTFDFCLPSFCLGLPYAHSAGVSQRNVKIQQLAETASNS